MRRPPDVDGAKTVSLARFGHYDVRLVEFVPANHTDPTPMWLELYSHETQCAIDSCRCYDLEAAAQATEGLISRPRSLTRHRAEPLGIGSILLILQQKGQASQSGGGVSGVS